ncbi:hypothetical protein [Succinimonas sp.]|uniref:hypothetical protein n=1 Tax=Succinimonas sp. TaxID=1936151 RepID=UPI00386CF751
MTFLKKIKLPLLTAAMLMTSVSFANAALADDGVIQKKNSVIYTGNFALADKTSSQAQVQSPRETLGSLHDYDVVSGEKNPHHLAFVKKTKGRSYVILDKIFVKCSRKNPCQLPEDLGAVKLSERLWEVTVSDYDSWKTRVKELKEIPGVIKVSPAFDYGVKAQLK